MLAEILETLMILSFGVSWPINLAKAIRSRSTGGKSIMFDYLIGTGYVCGILSKILSHNFNLAFWFYFPNITLVCTDFCLYFRNKKIEAEEEKKAA